MTSTEGQPAPADMVPGPTPTSVEQPEVQPIALWNQVSGYTPSKRKRRASSEITEPEQAPMADESITKKRRLSANKRAPRAAPSSVSPEHSPSPLNPPKRAVRPHFRPATDLQDSTGAPSEGETTPVPPQSGDPASEMPHESRSEDLPASPSAPALSKSALKKQRRREVWEAGRQSRKDFRRQKKADQRLKKRAENAQKLENGEMTVQDLRKPSAKVAAQRKSERYPVAIVLDCGFDDLMTDNEISSLGSQLTRAYADNRQAVKRGQLAVVNWGGRLRGRFEWLMGGMHKNWKDVSFLDEAFVEARDTVLGSVRKAPMATDEQTEEPVEKVVSPVEKPSSDPTDPANASYIYLTSDSPHTIATIEPHKAYIIGGLVDRNRHKGICYQRAQEAGIATARLPIGEYMKMASRFVLTTNQVVEILLKWLEYEDWGRAFVEVMPKRKGGILREEGKADRLEQSTAEGIDEKANANNEPANGLSESHKEHILDAAGTAAS